MNPNQPNHTQRHAQEPAAAEQLYSPAAPVRAAAVKTLVTLADEWLADEHVPAEQAGTRVQGIIIGGPWSGFDYDFSGADFFYPVHRAGAFWGGKVTARNATWRDDVFMETSVFNGDASFSGGTYLGKTIYVFGCIYRRNLDRSHCTYGTVEGNYHGYTHDFTAAGSVYRGAADFSNSTYDRGVCSHGNTYYGPADLSGCTYRGKVNYSKNRYGANLTMRGCTYGASAQIGESAHIGDADYSCSVYEADASFYGSRYLGNATFAESQYRGGVYHVSEQFIGSAHFDGVQFGHTANPQASSSFLGSSVFAGAMKG